jgi:hypothetical protein
LFAIVKATWTSVHIAEEDLQQNIFMLGTIIKNAVHWVSHPFWGDPPNEQHKKRPVKNHQP